MKNLLQKFLIITSVFLFIFTYSTNVFSADTTTFSMTDSTLTTYSSGSDYSSSNSSTCTTGAKKDLTEIFTYLLCVMDEGIIPVLISIGLIIFLAGVVKFVTAGDNEEKRQGGRQMMIFGIIALFVMVAVWGFVNLLSNTIFGKNSELQTMPKKSSSFYATN